MLYSIKPAYIFAGILVLLCAFLLLYRYIRIRRFHYSHYKKGEFPVRVCDTLDGIEFEELCCMILLANGFDSAENTQASVDFGVDILASKDDVTYGIQCKRYDSKVGIDAVQQAYSGAAYYDCETAVVLSNNYYTSSAKKLADKLGVLLWDRDILEEMM